VVVFFEKIIQALAPIKGGLCHALNSAKNAQWFDFAHHPELVEGLALE